MAGSIHELSESELKTLGEKAIAAKARAYCPYSNFRVGSSLLLTDGCYFTGSNVEVAATPVGICAERCALAPCVASIARPALPQIRALAVSTDISPPASPCGMCRQFIREFCPSSMPIYMYDKHDAYTVKTIGELLPMSFGPGDLESNQQAHAPFAKGDSAAETKGVNRSASSLEMVGQMGEVSSDMQGGSVPGGFDAVADEATRASGQGSGSGGGEYLVDGHGSLMGQR